jgi:hypothetical protein
MIVPDKNMSIVLQRRIDAHSSRLPLASQQLKLFGIPKLNQNVDRPFIVIFCGGNSDFTSTSNAFTNIISYVVLFSSRDSRSKAVENLLPMSSTRFRNAGSHPSYIRMR